MTWSNLVASLALVAGATAQCDPSCLQCEENPREGVSCVKCPEGWDFDLSGLGCNCIDPEFCPPEEEEPDDRRVYIDVKGNSGRIALGLQENVNSDPNRIMIAMDSLRELAADKETAVGGSGNNKHSVENFAQLDFTYSDVERGTYPGTELSVDIVSFEAAVQDSATFRVNIYYFFEGGVIDNDGEEVEVSDGTVKFSVDMENWTWCEEGGEGWSSCRQGQQEQVGEYLQFGLTVQTKSRLQEEEESGSAFATGDDDVTVAFSRKVIIDGEWHSEDLDEPTHRLTGNTDRFQLVFPKFQNSMSYDPTVQYSDALLFGSPSAASAPLYLAAGVGCVALAGAGVYAYKQRQNKAVQSESEPLV